MSDPSADATHFYRDARTDLDGPLQGVRVLEVTSTWAGPRCACMLADYGADVVKIEPCGSPDVAHRLPPFLEHADPPVSFFDAAVNRNKRNVALDLRRPPGRDVFLELARTADVVVESFRPGRMKDWGLGYDDVRAVKGDIIYVSISGYGQFGPYATRAGYDPTAQALSGLMWLNATGDNPPMKTPIYISDELAGVHAAFATLAALVHRDARGEGQHIDVSLVDATVASSTGQPTLAAQGLPTPRYGNTYPFGSPSNAYPCRDGWLYAGVLLDTHWAKLSVLLGHAEMAHDPEYATIPARVARRAELDEMLADFCQARTRDEIIAQFSDIGLSVEKILTPAEMVDDPHIRARGTIQSVKQPSGVELRIEGPPAKMSRTPVRIRRAAPQHGMHTDEVLAAAGFDEARRRKLREQGVI
jgi:formyl-CoA transferase